MPAAAPAHRLPQFLADGTRFIFTSTLGTDETNGVYVGSLDKTPPVRHSAGRHRRTVRRSRQAARRSDRARCERTTSILNQRRCGANLKCIAQGFGGAASITVFATSDTGVLAYRAGTAQRRQLMWVNRQGAVLRDDRRPRHRLHRRAGTEHRRTVGAGVPPADRRQRYLGDRARAQPGAPVTDGPPADAHPIWDPDGQHVVFNSQRFGSGPTRQALTGGKAEPLFTNKETGLVLSWTRDRRYILLRRDSAASRADLVGVATVGRLARRRRRPVCVR